MNKYQIFQPGQKVRNLFGKTLTVLFQDGCYVKVVEDTLGHYHPSKLFPCIEVREIDGTLERVRK